MKNPKKAPKPPDALELRRLAAKAELVKALAHPLRLAIVEFLADGERCVCEIAELAGAERSNISRHLALMVRAGVLSNRKQGLQVYYSLRCRCIGEFMRCVTDLLRERVEESACLLSGRRGAKEECVSCRDSAGKQGRGR